MKVVKREVKRGVTRSVVIDLPPDPVTGKSRKICD